MFHPSQEKLFYQFFRVLCSFSPEGEKVPKFLRGTTTGETQREAEGKRIVSFTIPPRFLRKRNLEGMA
jgi:hypothetical protein